MHDGRYFLWRKGCRPFSWSATPAGMMAGMTKTGRGRLPGEKARQEALAALYEELPAMNCQGLCSDSCYSLVQTGLEQRFVRDRTGVELGLVQAPPTACPALTMLNQCGVYEVRPLICRLWGMTSGMRCQYGCEPQGGFLTAEQMYEFLARAAEIAGDPEEAKRLRAPFEVDPERAEKMMMMLQRERDLDYERRVRTAKNPVFMVGPGRFVKERPRGGRG
jgi:Fe-S-cluster containining protein